MNDNEKWIIREAKGEDLAFIYSTWAKSYRYDADLTRGCKNSVFFPEYATVIDHILSQPGTQVQVAALESNPNVILGYFISEGCVGHYTFVKEAFQARGIAKALWKNSETPISIASHRTSTIEPVLNRYAGSVVYNPFVLFKQKRDE